MPKLPKKIEIIQQARNHRVFPGQGNFKLIKFIKKLKDIGYNGYFSLEVLNKNFSNLTPANIMTQAERSIENLFKNINNNLT